MKVDILAIGAHPDDVELSCGGTLAKEIAAGKKVAILDLTRGELGTRGNAEIRLKEATKAAEILGVTARYNLDFADGFFLKTIASIKRKLSHISVIYSLIWYCAMPQKTGTPITEEQLL